MWGISGLAERLASQKGLCFLELFCSFFRRMYRQHSSVVFRLCTAFFSMTNVYLRCGFISTHCSDVSNALIDFSMTLTHVTVDGRPKGAPSTTVLRRPSTSWPVREFLVLIEHFLYLTSVLPPKVTTFQHTPITQIGIQTVVILWCINWTELS